MEDMVLDASMGCRDGLYCFCPVIYDDENQIASVVTGAMFLSNSLPERGRVVAVVHDGGQGAVDEFCMSNPEIITLIEGQPKKETQP